MLLTTERGVSEWCQQAYFEGSSLSECGSSARAEKDEDGLYRPKSIVNQEAHILLQSPVILAQVQVTSDATSMQATRHSPLIQGLVASVRKASLAPT